MHFGILSSDNRRMRPHIKNKELHCRICLVQPQNESLMPTEPDFPVQIKRCTGVDLSETPNWPNHICTSCALLLRAALKLRSLCQKAEKELEEQQLQEIHIQIIHNDQDMKQKCDDGLDQPKKLTSGSDSELEYEFLESYDMTLDNNEDADCSADEMVSIEPANSVPEESACSLSPKPATEDEEDSSQTPCFVCTICQNVYTERVKLSNHMKVHNTEKPHECEICHKRFRQTPQLARHMNTHTGNRPYKCDYCDSRFADPSTRIKHQSI
ncbi:zinc finger and SCAN domain-containing protein 12 isoform X2 [Drosophila eugracilis]|uniref:zinc finger and SCAN domain-containing protein 12 isoform X2 n=1 Tax=Drosophila eugracilis TaxID=29029 RepID=UPI001BD993B9|nr:zinc finger and SCAN domain-containing protein 12 isoform X2 [Drosophila eugracilis]